jgi:hypothetical protein
MTEAGTMRWWAIWLMALTVTAGCERARHRTPEFSEEQMQRLKAADPGITAECLEKLRWGDDQSMATDQCYKMDDVRRWRGLWANDFEGSLFCPVPANGCPSDSEDDQIWLEFADPATRAKLPHPGGGLYAIDFYGRRTRYKGLHGHFGMAEHEIIVDRLVSIREIKAPPPEPTKAEIVAEMRRCEADRTCIPDWNAIDHMPE